MKKEIDLRKFDGKAESANICRYLGRDYEPISTWDQLIPMMQEIGDDFIGLDGGDTFCDADLIYDHNMHCLLYKDVHYVRNKVSKLVDYINKHKRKVVEGNLYKLTVGNLYVYDKLRDALADDMIHHVVDGAYVWIDKDEQQVWSFIYEEKSHMFIADFCNNYFEADEIEELIEKMYDEAGYPVEVKIVFEA
jgi:hypothetical protein